MADDAHRPAVPAGPSASDSAEPPGGDPPAPWWARALLGVVALSLRAVALCCWIAILGARWSAPYLLRGGARALRLCALFVRRARAALVRWGRASLAAAPYLGRALVATAASLLSGLRTLVFPTAALTAVAALTILLWRIDAPASPRAPARPAGAKSPTAGDDPFDRSHATIRESDLPHLRHALLSGDAARRSRALDKLLAATSDDARLLHTQLLRRSQVSAAAYKRVLRAIGAQVPDRHGRFGPAPPKRPDWLEALVGYHAPDRYAARARAEAIYSVALMRALVATRRTEVGSSLLRFAYRHGGAFRDECGRLLRQLRDYAIPALVRAEIMLDPLAYRMKRYAAYQLDRIDRVRPELALQQQDLGLLAEILHAYGEVRHSAAVVHVIGKTDHRDPRVRRAARWATLRYVSGRAPKVTKRKLKLAGGRTTTRERALYLSYRQLATHRLAKDLAKLRAGDRAGDKGLDELVEKYRREYEPRELAEQLFSAYDERRRGRAKERVNKALASLRTGDLESAVKAVDRLATADPDHPARLRMAAVLRRYGARLLQRGRHEAAVVQFTKGLHLLPPAGEAGKDAARVTSLDRQLRAGRLVAEALGDGRGGAAVEWKLERAVHLDPSSTIARQYLRRYGERDQHGSLIVVSVAGLCAAIVLGLLLVLRRRRLI